MEPSGGLERTQRGSSPAKGRGQAHQQPLTSWDPDSFLGIGTSTTALSANLG